jgi:phage gp36-like protein
MRFLALADLYARRGQAEMLRLAGNVDGEPNLARIISAIGSAEAEALSYLTSRYTEDQLPVTPETTPDVLKDTVATLAHRRLAGSVQVAPALETEATEARAWLSRAARGIVNLGLSSQPQVDRGTAQILVTQTNPGTNLTFDTLEDW